MPQVRITEIRRRRQRKQKLAALRRRFQEAESSSSRKPILDKLARLAPHFSEKHFEATAKKA